MARKTNNRIQKRHLILCEGADAENFLIYWLNNPALSTYPFFANDIQVMDFGGITDLPLFIQSIKAMEGYHDISSLLVIRDAERDEAAAKQAVCAALQKAALPVPTQPHRWANGENLKTGFLLFPVCGEHPRSGTLEDLCLEILKEENREMILAEVQGLMDRLHDKHGREFPHELKTKLHTYFSVTDDFVSMKIGEAARAGAFDWHHPALWPIRDFILELLPA